MESCTLLHIQLHTLLECYYLSVVQKKLKPTRSRHSNHLKSLKLQPSKRGSISECTYFNVRPFSLAIDLSKIKTPLSQPLAWKSCYVQFIKSQTECSIIISKWTTVSIYMLNCLNWPQPWFWSELLAVFAACCFVSLNPHNRHILNFHNHLSNGGPGTLQICVDIQNTVLQEFWMKTECYSTNIIWKM